VGVDGRVIEELREGW